MCVTDVFYAWRDFCAETRVSHVPLSHMYDTGLGSSMLLWPDKTLASVDDGSMTTMAHI